MARLRSLLLALPLLTSCASAPTHPTLASATLPPLVPVRDFFVNVESNSSYRISPDGTRLAWLAVDDRRLTVWFKTLGSDDARPIDTHSSRSIFWFTWARDSRRILYGQDRAGDENTHIYVADPAKPETAPRDLTPFPGARAYVQRMIRTDPEHVLVADNARDTSVFDLYRVSLTTGQRALVAENPGDVTWWITDPQGRLRGRFRKATPTEVRFELLRDDGAWATFRTLDLDDTLIPLGFARDGRTLWALSNLGRDRVGLARLDLATGRETPVYEAPGVDVEHVVMSEATDEPLMAVSFPDHQARHFLDGARERDLAPLASPAPYGLRLVSVDDAERLVTVTRFTDRGSEHFLLDRATGAATLLGRSSIWRHASALATVEPVALTSRDGLPLHGYLTVPDVRPAGPVPMVLFVHGGPWARDHWGYNEIVQFLANRGYAVLQINYRGSSGYGRAFREAGIRQHAGKMHDDLIDAVRWAVARGVADPDRIAIYGASYGGYATLVGMTFTPEVFACGVDVVGMSSLVTLLERRPPYWKLYDPYFVKYYGDLANPDDRRRLEAQSPLFKAHQLARPLLVIHGANDARVNRAESEQMVDALRKAGKPVEYVVFPDEGHLRAYGNWKNSLRLYRTIESFLAKHLGGRDAGFDYYQLGLLLP